MRVLLFIVSVVFAQGYLSLFVGEGSGLGAQLISVGKWRMGASFHLQHLIVPSTEEYGYATGLLLWDRDSRWYRGTYVLEWDVLRYVLKGKWHFYYGFMFQSRWKWGLWYREVGVRRRGDTLYAEPFKQTVHWALGFGGLVGLERWIRGRWFVYGEAGWSWELIGWLRIGGRLREYSRFLWLYPQFRVGVRYRLAKEKAQ